MSKRGAYVVADTFISLGDAVGTILAELADLHRGEGNVVDFESARARLRGQTYFSAGNGHAGRRSVTTSMPPSIVIASPRTQGNQP